MIPSPMVYATAVPIIAPSPCLSGNRGCNRVRSVMEAVGVAEEQCNGNDDAHQDQVKIHGSGFLQCKGFDDIGQIFESIRT